MKRRLAFKLAVYTVLMATIMGTVVAAVGIRNAYEQSTREIVATAAQFIELELQAASEAVYQLDPKIARDLLNGLMQHELFLEAAISDEIGHELARVSKPRSPLEGLVGLIELPLREFHYELPLRNDPAKRGSFTAVLDVQAGLVPFYELALTTAAGQILLAIGLSLLVFFVVMYLVTTPLGNLAKELAEVDPGSERRLAAPPSHRYDELGTLVESANRYLDAASQYHSELARHRQNWEDILDNLHEGVVTVNQAGVITGANAASENMFGYAEDQTIGLQLADLLAPEHRELAGRIVERAASGDPALGIAMSALTRDGHNLPIEVSVTTTNLAAGPHSVWTIRDISERAKAERDRLALEEQLRQSQKMEAIGTLAGGIAHDFNNMLGGIVGYAELAALEAPKGSKLKGYIDNVLSVAGKASQLVKQILTFSSNRKEKKQVVDLTKVVEECASLIRQSFPPSIELVTEYKGPAFTILADETMMHQIVMNLLTNAATAIGEDPGRISLSLDYADAPVSADVSAAPSQEPVYIRLRLQDTGGGISDDIIHRIFEPFFTTKGVGVGTGMGLAVVHSIVQNHDGWIEVDNSADGAVFTVLFPFAERMELEENTGNVVELPHSVGDERILLAEDDGVIADLLMRVLTRQGYDVVVAVNGDQALATYRAAPDRYDLVVTDQNMPGRLGHELSQEVLSLRPDQPIILCTGFSSTVTEEYALSLGIRRYLIKPVSIHDLCDAVRSVLDEPENKTLLTNP